ncbi:hypothetical protein J5N97_015547 [Dioscorea zingiberensis]|uniref:S-protein homolog n=1 Tax=Dioscorea zingiberensis TaxID=325984 RepID=A0A9D5HKT9_9LILI|nr:hypothetical protein J5N97_015547 [Dioscorea zingiberensis]
MDSCLKFPLLVLLLASCLCSVPSVSEQESRSNETVILFGPKVISSDACTVEAGRTSVHILNRLGEGKNLSVHCKSKDDDLQQQTVAEGQELVWAFNPNIWGTTLFFCDLNPTLNFAFDAYDYKRDQVRCASQCHWLVAAEGMYALNEAAHLWAYIDVKASKSGEFLFPSAFFGKLIIQGKDPEQFTTEGEGVFLVEAQGVGNEDRGGDATVLGEHDTGAVPSDHDLLAAFHGAFQQHHLADLVLVVVVDGQFVGAAVVRHRFPSSLSYRLHSTFTLAPASQHIHRLQPARTWNI